MKKLSIIALLAISASASAATLQVKVDGVSSDKGTVNVYVCDQANFPKNCKIAVVVPAHAGTVTADFPEVPAGTWAVTVFHDENSNKKFDTNALGIPKEGYGFSNGAKARFSAPSFKEAAITLADGANTAAVKMTY
jgi:uncharacterized protein (DUF2141 family)